MEDSLLPENMSIASGEYQIADNEYKIANDLTTQKSIELSNSLLAKRQAVLGVTNQDPSKWEVIDGDTIKDISGNTVRLDPLMGGLSLDTYETNHGTKWEQQPLNQAKLLKQRLALTDLKNKDKWFPWTKTNLDEVTNQDVYKQGELAKQKLKDTLLGLNNVELNQFKFEKADSRNKGDVRTVGDINNKAKQSLLDALNTPEFNAAYNTKYNAAKNTLDSKNTVMQDVGDIATNIVSRAVGLTGLPTELIDMGSGAVTAIANKLGADLSEPLSYTKALADGAEIPFTDGFRVGFDPNRTAKIIKDYLQSNEAVANEVEYAKRKADAIKTKGDELSFGEEFGLSMKFIGDHPKYAIDAVAESIPDFFLMGAAAKRVAGKVAETALKEAGLSITDVGAKDVLATAYKTNKGRILGASALSEGIISAGSDYQGLIDEGIKSTKAALPSIAAGAVVSLINLGLGHSPLGDAITKFVTKDASSAAKETLKGALTKTLTSVGSESVEEGLQSPAETILTNVARDKANLLEGAGYSAAEGTVSGGILGGSLTASQTSVNTLKSALNARREAKQEEAVQAVKTQVEIDSEAIKTVTEESDLSKLNQHITNIVGSIVSTDTQIDILNQFKDKDPTSFETRKEELQPKLDKLYQQSTTKDDPNLIADNIHTSKLTPLATESIQVIDKEVNKTISDDPNVLATINPNKILDHVKRITYEQGKTDLSTLENKLEYQNVVNTALVGFNIIVNKVGINVTEEEKQDYAQIHNVLAKLETHILENTDMTNKAEVDNLIKSNFGSYENEKLNKANEEASKDSSDAIRQARAITHTKLAKVYSTLKFKLRRVPGLFGQVIKEVFEGTGDKPAIKEHQLLVMAAMDSDKPSSKLATVVALNNFGLWNDYHSEKQIELTKVNQAIIKHGINSQQAIDALVGLNTWAKSKNVVDIEGNAREYKISKKNGKLKFGNLTEQVTLEAKAMQIAFHALRDEASIKFGKDELPNAMSHLLDTEVVTTPVVSEEDNSTVQTEEDLINRFNEEQVVTTEPSRDTKVDIPKAKQLYLKVKSIWDRKVPGARDDFERGLEDDLYELAKKLSVYQAGSSVQEMLNRVSQRLAELMNPPIIKESKPEDDNTIVTEETTQPEQDTLQDEINSGLNAGNLTELRNQLTKKFGNLDSKIFEYLTSETLEEDTVVSRIVYIAKGLARTDIEDKTNKDYLFGLTLERNIANEEFVKDKANRIEQEDLIAAKKGIFNSIKANPHFDITDKDNKEIRNVFYQAVLKLMKDRNASLGLSVNIDLENLRTDITIIINSYYDIKFLLKENKLIYKQFWNSFNELEDKDKPYIPKAYKPLNTEVDTQQPLIANNVDISSGKPVKSNKIYTLLEYLDLSKKIKGLFEKTVTKPEIKVILKTWNPTTWFGKYPNFFKLMSNPLIDEHIVSIEGKTSLDTVASFVEEFTKEFIKTGIELDSKRAKQTKTNLTFHIENNPLDLFQTLISKDGKRNIDPNIISSIGVSTLNWLNTSAKNTLFKDQKTMKLMLGLQENDSLNQNIYNLLADKGDTEVMLVNSLSSAITQGLEIYPNDNIDDAMFSKLKTSLGLYVLNTLYNQGLLEYSNIENTTYGKFKKNEWNNEYIHPENTDDKVFQSGSIRFIKVIPKKDSEGNVVLENKKPVLPDNLTKIFSDIKAGRKELSNLFGLNWGQELPLLVKPTKDDVIESLGGSKTKAPTAQNSNQEITPNRVDALTSYVQTPITANTKSYKLFSAMSKDALEQIEFGKLYGQVLQKFNEKSYIGKLLSFDNNYRAIIDTVDALEGNLSKVFYFMSTYWLQGRVGGISSAHPQKNKIARAVFKPEHFKVTVDSEVKRTMFKMAILEAFGTAVKKFNKHGNLIDKNGETVSMETKFQDILNNVVNQQAIAEIKLQEAGKPFDESKIVAAVVAAGEGFHSFDGIVALAQYDAVNSFESDLGREVDGITNGVLIGIILLSGIRDFQASKSVLEAAGVYIDPSMTYGDWIQQVNDETGLYNEDNYQQTTRTVVREVSNFITNLDDRFVRQHFRNEQEARDAINASSNLIGQLTVDDTLDSAISSVGRNFSKYPLMITSFGAAIFAVSRAIANDMVQNFYDKLQEIINTEDSETYNRQRELDSLKENMSKLVRSDSDFMTKLVIDDKLESLKNFTLDYRDNTRIINIVSDIYRPVMTTAINKHFATFQANRKTLNDAYFVVNEIYRKLIDSWTKANPNASGKQFDEYIESIKEVQPLAATAESDELKYALQLWDSEKSSSADDNYKVQIKWNNNGTATYYYKVDIEGNLTSKAITLPKTASSHAVHLVLKALSVGVTIVQIHNMDSNPIVDLMKSKYKGYGVHDAWIYNMFEVVEGTRLMNKSLYDNLKKHDVFNAAKNNLERVVEFLESKANSDTISNKLYQNILDDINRELQTRRFDDRESIFRRQEFWDYDRETREYSAKFSTLEEYLTWFKGEAIRLEAQKQKEIFNNIYESGFKQYGGMDATEATILEQELVVFNEKELARIFAEKTAHVPAVEPEVPYEDSVEAITDRKFTLKGKSNINPALLRKDQGKANIANAYIGYGIKGSSTEAYLNDAQGNVSTNESINPSKDTIAFVSVNGNKQLTTENKAKTLEQIKRVLNAGGVIVMDNSKVANSTHNKSGEGVIQQEIQSIPGIGMLEVNGNNQYKMINTSTQTNEGTSKYGSQESTPTNLFQNRLADIDSTNILDTANRLENVGNVRDEDTHTTHLKSILGGFISKVLQPLQYFEMTSPEANIGEYDPSGKIGLNISNAPIAPTVKVPMSALTTFVHELVHGVTASALFDPKNSILRSRVQKIFNHIERNISNEDKEKYSHIFANKNKTPLANGTVVNHGLAELIAFAETEPMFRELLNSLPKMSVGKITKTWDESKDKIVEANLLEIISNVFNKIMVWWNDKIKGEHSTDVLTQLHTLTVQLSTAHLKAKSTIYDFKLLSDKSDNFVLNKLHRLLVEPLLKLLGNNYFTLNPNKNAAVMSNSARDLLNAPGSAKAKVDKLFEFTDIMKKNLNISEEHWLTYSLNEITGQIAVGNFTQALNMTKKLRDKVIATIQNTISSNLRSGFKINLTKQLERVIYNNLLKTDLSSLQDYYKDDLLDMFDGSKRKVEQDKLKKEILKNKNGKLYLGHAYNTAFFMVHNQATKSFQHSTLMNATQIYNMQGSNFKPVGDKDGTVELLDKLIGLYVLDIVNQDELNTLKDLFNTDNHGLNVTMEVHRQQKEHHLNDILKGNKSLVVKGSTKELTNPNRQIIIATAAEEEKLKLHHYTKGNKIIYEGKGLYVYHSKFRLMQPWVQGIISYTHMNNILSDMKGVMKQSDGLDQIIQDEKLDKSAKAKMLDENNRNANKIVFDTTEADYTLNPVFNGKGYVSKHSFMLSNQDKENLLDMNTNFTHVLGAMVANITDKLNTQRLNDESAKMLIKNRMDNLETKGIQWITLSKDAKTKNERDIWNKLPKEFKETILKESGSNEVVVNAKLLKMIFGQRKLSLSDFFRPADEQELSTFVKYFGSQLYPYIKKANLDRGTQIWQESVGYLKDQLVVKSGTVLAGNEVSNLWVAFMEGMTFKQYFKAKTEALRLVIDYHKLQTQINDIEYLLTYDKEMSSTMRTNLETKLSNLSSTRNLSLVKKYEDAGQMKTIVEDGLEDENIWSFRNEFFESRIKSVTDKLPKPIKAIGREVFMTHDTKMYQLMKDLTQMSDLTSRIAVGEFKQSHGMTEKEALQLVDEAFINYDIPSHQNVQFAADMGLFMFNKFFFRIQPVIAREVGQHPARFLTLLGMEQVFGAQEAIHHSLMTPDTLIGHVSNPLKLPYAIWDSNFYNWLFSFHAPDYQPT